MNLFLNEILEQPGAIESLAGFYGSDAGLSLLTETKKLISDTSPRRIILTGMGSSFFVADAAAALFNSLRMPSFAMNTSELLHYNLSLLDQSTLLICISQSGESYEIRELLAHLDEKVHCIGIVNDEGSFLARKASIVLPCKAGPEKMTSTKTYVATSLVSFILGWHLDGVWTERRVKQVMNLRGGFKALLDNCAAATGQILTFLGDISTIQIIGRGPSYSTACQSALMFKEALHIPATGILGGEFRHGPMEMVAEGFKSLLFAPKGNTFSQSVRMAEDIARFGGKVLLITGGEYRGKNPDVRPVFISNQDEFLFSVQAIVPVQLFVDTYAKAKGFEAGSFSRGGKVTNIE